MDQALEQPTAQNRRSRGPHDHGRRNAMKDQLRTRWQGDILQARERAQKSARLGKFKNLGWEQAQRASFFVELSEVIRALGISNPHESSALSIEPTHPVQSRFMGRSLDKLGISPLLGARREELKVSLISMAMLERYSPESDAARIRSLPVRTPLHLLDPLYGFVFIRAKEKIHNHCFALDIWGKHLGSMPAQLSRELWANRSDSMLSGGALAGRYLFSDLIPPAPDAITRSSSAVVHVESEEELLDLVGRLKLSASKTPNVELWFRGQGRDRLTPDRSEIHRIGLTPYSNLPESDFTPSLYRRYDRLLDDLDDFEAFILDLAEWVHFAKLLVPENVREAGVRLNAGPAALTPDSLSSYQKGLLLQQYGAPSAYLDISSDPAIAAWFATHACSITNEKRMLYQSHSWDSSNPDEWPTIFVFPLVKGVHPYLDLASMLKGSAALRAERQKCGLLGGSGNLARNYCARYLGLKIRLKPGFKLSNPLPASHFFPPASEDLTFSYLKDQGLGDTQRQLVLSELA
jgi:hypothetical protein